MNATMCDRGADGEGLWAQGPVAFGYRRLKIVDLSGRGSQPMVDLGVEIRGTLIPADRALSGPKRARLHAVDPEAEPSLEGEQTA